MIFRICVLLFMLVVMSAAGLAGDSVFVSIDMHPVALPTFRGVEPTPFIIWRELSSARYFTRLLTLDDNTGAQLGLTADVEISYYGEPVCNLWADFFSLDMTRGVEPSPFILFRNYRLLTFTAGYGPDGSPTLASFQSFQLTVDPMYGQPTSLGEMPAEFMPDGMPRLIIGTDLGYIVLVVNTFVAGLQVDAAYPICDRAIVGLELIPQYNYCALGVLTDNVLYGIDFSPPPDKDGASAYAYVFIQSYQGEGALTDLTCPRAADGPLTNPYDSVAIVLADGTSQVGVATFGSMTPPTGDFDAAWYPVSAPVTAICSGSLLMLTADNTGVVYDPGFTPETGPGWCSIDIVDGIGDDCTPVCGDANNDEAVNVGDAVFLINYVFKEGPAPPSLVAGDANCDLAVNVGDAVYIINYTFKGGPDPCASCP